MMQSEALPVTQEDRDAGDNLWIELSHLQNDPPADMPTAAHKLLYGALARHRLATEARLAAARQPAMDDQVERAFREGFEYGEFAGGGAARAGAVNDAWRISKSRAAIAALRPSSDGVDESA
jgi:hypothetical protein